MIADGNLKRCAVCGYPFPPDAKPSMSVAFAEYLLKAHKPGQTRFSDLIAPHLTDSRAKNTQLPLADLLRQSIYSRMAGYEDVNDAERLAQGPTFRLIGSEKISERGAALTSRLQSFETELLTQGENLSGLAAINRALIAQAEAFASPQ